MKLAFMTFACPDWRFDEVVAAAIRHGYHGVEFRCDAGHLHGVEVAASRKERAAMRDKLHNEHVELCCLATSLRFVFHEAVEELAERAELAADLGCSALRVFCGQPAESIGHEELVARCAHNLRAASDIASHSGVELWLETHDAASRAAVAVAIIHAVNQPNVAINYDNMHPHRAGESLETTVAQLGSLVRHCHFHDSLNRPDQVVIRPLDRGELPMDEMFQALVRMGFDGYLSGEWFDRQYGDDPDEALEAYHRDMVRLAERNGVHLAAR